MNIGCREISELVKSFSLVKDCTALPNGTLRLATAFRYPNGSFVDLFIRRDESLFPGYVITDFGQTAVYLRNLHIKIDSTRKRKQTLDDICEALNVHRQDNQIFVAVADNEVDSIPETMARLAQACIRISDLSYMQRFPMSASFKEEVEEFIEGAEFEYEPDIPIPGKYGKLVVVDFQVHGQRDSLLKTLSTRNPATAHELMNEILRCWVDLAEYVKDHKLVTIIDDRDMPYKDKLYRKDDLARIGDFSKLFAFPSQQEEIKELLAA